MSAKILLVEDDQYIRELYAHILTGRKHIVEEVDNGEDAYNRIISNTYDIILLDIMIPKIDGLQLLEKLKKEGKGDKIKQVILLTNLDEEGIVEKGVSYGVSGYMIKSQNPPDKLVEQVESFLKPDAAQAS